MNCLPDSKFRKGDLILSEWGSCRIVLKRGEKLEYLFVGLFICHLNEAREEKFNNSCYQKLTY